MGFNFQILTTENSRVKEKEDKSLEYGVGSWGAEAIYVIMCSVGVLDLELGIPPGGEWPPEGIDEERAERIIYSLEWGIPLGHTNPTDIEMQIMRKYSASSYEWRGTKSQVAGKVPCFKFRTNDAWIVSKEECTSIYEAIYDMMERMPRVLKNAGSDPLFDYLSLAKEWADFNKSASLHFGYEVN